MKSYTEKTPLAKVWKLKGEKHHHGVCTPLSALRSQLSGGIGEFGELTRLADWCKEVGFDTIQILPLNDNNEDPSPFNAVSAMALNPVYLSLHMLPDWKEPLDELRKLNETDTVQYQKVREKKDKLLRKYYANQYAIIYLTPRFQFYLKQNQWLTPYGLYKALKKKYNGKCWTEWPKEARDITNEKAEELMKEHNEEIVYHYFVQFLCHMQLEATRVHANKQGVKLMGDIPILVSKDSADVWWYREQFDLENSAGAPPDIFNKEGQNWGFPIYNWDVLKKSDFFWWRRRLFHANNYYDMYRLDHALGFFHLWTIPKGKNAKQGHYTPKKEEGYKHGKEILKILCECSIMLPIAEDLGGIVPHEIADTLQDLGMPGIRWIRHERKWNGDKSFIPYKDYHPINLTTVSTHDSETLDLWWQNFPEEVKEFCKFKGWKPAKKLSPERRLEILRDAHHTPTYFHINLLQEYLALFPKELLWDKPEKERINVPGTVSPKNWTYRYKPNLETIYTHKGLREKIQEILK